jgi:AraC-like DNA-binding protein
MAWLHPPPAPPDPDLPRAELDALVGAVLEELAARLLHGQVRVLSLPPPRTPGTGCAPGLPHPLLLVPLRGASVIDTPAGPLRCQDGTLVALPAHCPHHERIDPARGPFCNLALAVTAGQLTYHLAGAYPAGADTTGIVCPGSAAAPDPFGQQCLERAHAHDGRHGHDLQLGALIAFCAWARAAIAARSDALSGSAERLRKVRWLVATRLAWPGLSVESLARELGLHPDYLTRLFKAGSGETLVGYIRQQRMLHAQELLARQPPLEVRAVAAMCGFTDPAYFSRVFQHACGCPPAVWRREREAGPAASGP